MSVELVLRHGALGDLWVSGSSPNCPPKTIIVRDRAGQVWTEGGRVTLTWPESSEVVGLLTTVGLREADVISLAERLERVEELEWLKMRSAVPVVTDPTGNDSNWRLYVRPPSDDLGRHGQHGPPTTGGGC